MGLSAGAHHCERLAMGPDPEHGIRPAWVVLGYDRDSQRQLTSGGG